MILPCLFRLRKLQRLAKSFVLLLFVCLILYLVSKRTVPYPTVKSPAKEDIQPYTYSKTLENNGKLNVHLWREVCGSEMKFLQKSQLFPLYPDEKKFITEFQRQDDRVDYGQRIFGFIHPPKTGFYRLAISSDDASELWLSSGEDLKEKQLIARVYSASDTAWTEKGELYKYSDQISDRIMLQSGNKYYVEVIHKQGVGLGFVQVYWKTSNLRGEDFQFQIIRSKYLSEYSNDPLITPKKDILRSLFSTPNKKSNNSGKDFLTFFSLPVVYTKKDYLPPCVYKTSFVPKDPVFRYNGRHLVYESIVYPEDDTEMGPKGNVRSWPNRVAHRDVIHAVVDKIIASLSRKTSKQYFLKKIHKVLQKSDPVYGDRFSVDLEVGLKNDQQSYRLSEHVYLKKGSNSLCFPEGINCNSKATIYFILPVKNQGKWVYHFIKQLSEASFLTGDTNFHVVVIDFESRDINMTKAFNTPLLRSRHTVVNMTGRFYKTLALNKGVELVPSPHDIVFLFDLHIDVPADILYSVRKNTIEGRIAYFPVVGRLECQSNSVDHRGYWEKDGYGIVAVYKSDWTRFGGMNAEDFKYKWGGEDWDLVDRVLNAQLEVERVKQPGLFHHFHSKQKSWN